MTRKSPNLSLTLAAAIAAAGLWSCGTQPTDPGITSQFPGATENEANLTQLATPCTFVADGGVATVSLASDEYALIGQTTNAALVGPPNLNPITVNGTACGAATVNSTKRINVNGAAGNETVIIDYLNGPFALGTAAAPGINIDLKAGTTDTVKIRGSSTDDVVWLATTDAGTSSLAGQYAIDVGLAGTAPAVNVKGVIFSNVEVLVISSGPGNDSVLTNGKPDAGFGGIPFGLANLAGSAPSLTFYGGEGNDTLDFGKTKGGPVAFYGGTENGGATGTDTADFSLRTNAITMAIGGAAAGESGESVTVGSDVEVLSGGAGGDTLSCAAALACTLNGNAGDDTLTGGSAADTLNGGAGNDVLLPGLGADTISGGAGVDTVSYAEAGRAAHGVTVTLPLIGNSATATNGDQAITNPDGGSALVENDSIDDSVENVVGSLGTDTIQGNDADNVIYGGPLADNLKGGAGNDTFLMGTSLASDGKDIIDGEGGEDTVDFSNGGSTLIPADWTKGWTVPIWITLNGGSASTVCGTGVANATFCQVTNVENVIGGQAANTITGDTNANRLEGGPGDDVIVGGSGDDVIAPGAGTNTVTCSLPGNGLLIGTANQTVGSTCH